MTKNAIETQNPTFHFLVIKGVQFIAFNSSFLIELLVILLNIMLNPL